MTPPVLEVDGLTKGFGGVQAVDDVSFNVQAGELVALIGPNGAGKTTCFHMLSGRVRPDAGDMRLEGRSLRGLGPRRIWRRGVGRTFQISAVFRALTVRENIQAALLSDHGQSFQLFTRAARAHVGAAERLLDLVGLHAARERPAQELPHGDLKRLELAMALAHRPKLLLLDEPAAGASAAERRALMALVSDVVRREGAAALFTEHDMDAVFSHADRVLVLNRGRLIAEGGPEAIQDDPEVRAAYLGSWGAPGSRGDRAERGLDEPSKDRDAADA